MSLITVCKDTKKPAPDIYTSLKVLAAVESGLDQTPFIARALSKNKNTVNTSVFKLRKKGLIVSEFGCHRITDAGRAELAAADPAKLVTWGQPEEPVRKEVWERPPVQVRKDDHPSQAETLVAKRQEPDWKAEAEYWKEKFVEVTMLLAGKGKQ